MLFTRAHLGMHSLCSQHMKDSSFIFTKNVKLACLRKRRQGFTQKYEMFIIILSPKLSLNLTMAVNP